MNKRDVLKVIHKVLSELCSETKDPLACEPAEVLENELKLKQFLQRDHRLRAFAYLAIGAAIVETALERKHSTKKSEDPLQGLPLPDTLKDELEQVIRKLKIKALIRGPLLLLYIMVLYAAILNGLLEIVSAFELKVVKNTLIDTIAELVGKDENLDFAPILLAFLSTVLVLVTQRKVFEILKHDIEILRTALDKQHYEQLTKVLMHIAKH